MKVLSLELQCQYIYVSEEKSQLRILVRNVKRICKISLNSQMVLYIVLELHSLSKTDVGERMLFFVFHRIMLYSFQKILSITNTVHTCYSSSVSYHESQRLQHLSVHSFVYLNHVWYILLQRWKPNYFILNNFSSVLNFELIVNYIFWRYGTQKNIYVGETGSF